jgi:hypothetical protein
MIVSLTGKSENLEYCGKFEEVILIGGFIWAKI